MKKQIRFIVVALMFVAGITGCSKQPVEEISSSRAAVETVAQESAGIYAAQELRTLQADLAAALDEVKVQDGKMLKNYDNAKQLLAKVMSDSEQVRSVVATSKEQARLNSIDALQGAQASLAEAKNALAIAPKGKGSRADIEAMGADLNGLEESMYTIQPLIDAGEYAGATEKAGIVSQKANEISSQVKLAMEKVAKENAEKEMLAKLRAKSASAKKVKK
ncbi:MAG: hypothetical protein KKE17_11615 [Proteobacteria bacterium]|nr:hypothetical protein [Pseudomonadota bacterium]MBU1710642.1 hypothetical protein [Pseudomonadota bacterium]